MIVNIKFCCQEIRVKGPSGYCTKTSIFISTLSLPLKKIFPTQNNVCSNALETIAATHFICDLRQTGSHINLFQSHDLLCGRRPKYFTADKINQLKSPIWNPVISVNCSKECIDLAIAGQADQDLTIDQADQQHAIIRDVDSTWSIDYYLLLGMSWSGMSWSGIETSWSGSWRVDRGSRRSGRF